MEHIYILKLNAGKYYIGKTKNIEKRWDEHIAGNGSGWTKKYKPISLVKSVISTSHFDEDKYVKEYMAKYGMDNVRGGTYSNIDLDDNSISSLKKEIWHSKNLCTRCGRNTHFIKDCYAKTDINDDIIDGDCKMKEAINKNNKQSYVYTKSKNKNKELSSSSDNSETDDDNERCKSKNSKMVARKQIKACDICGMKGHREVNCYNF
jgi:predicted GIY-YIG superfamily endonuclease